MYKAITDKLKAIRLISVKELFRHLFEDQEFKDLIIELNTIEQLYKKGIDSTGESIGDYQPFTIDEKIKKGQPYDRVTLKDTGRFYESFRVHFLNNYDGEILITAYTATDDGGDLIVSWGKDIIGLSEESLSELRTFVKGKLPDLIIKLINMPQ